jgi:hypothetical protein
MPLASSLGFGEEMIEPAVVIIDRMIDEAARTLQTASRLVATS